MRVFRHLAAGVILLACAGCSFVQFAAANAPDSFARIERRTNLPYAEGALDGEGARRRLDVYAPLGASNRPVVIFWYGGSWVKGSKSEYRFVGVALAKRGLVAVLPDYPLYPQAAFPQFESDGAMVVAWVERHAREFGGDPGNIVLMGHSAGGHTAAFLALNHEYLREHGADPRCISGLVGLSGTYVLVPDSDELRAAFAPPYTEADWQPIRSTDADAPPTLLLHGLADKEVSPSEARELLAALTRVHVPVQLRLYPHRGHASTVAAFALIARWRTPAVRDTVEFVDALEPRRGCTQEAQSFPSGKPSGKL